jgi:hypothetical protein
MLVQFFHGTADIKSWLVAVEDPTVQLREILKSGRIGFILHCDIVSVVVIMIEFWQLGSIEGNILWMTIWQTNTTCDVTLLGNLKLPRQNFLFMTTQFKSMCSHCDQCFCTQGNGNMYRIIIVKSTSSQPILNIIITAWATLRIQQCINLKSRTLAAARPAVQPQAVRISGGRTVAQPAAIFSMLCRVVAHRNQKIAWTGWGLAMALEGDLGGMGMGGL